MATQQVASGPIPVVPDKPKKQNKKSTSTPAPKPGKILPTEKINVARQLDFVRGFAALSNDGKKAVSVDEVASVLKVAASSVALASSFLGSIGIIVRTDVGYKLPSEAIAFLRAYEWNKETASHKLGPLLREAWFGKALIPRLLIAALEEREAIAALAEAAPANPEYRKELGMVLEFMVAGGVIVREGSTVKLVSRDTNSQAENANAKTETATNEALGTVRPNPGTVTTAFAEQPGSMSFNVSFRVEMSEIATWQPDRIQAFFRGVADALHAKANVEKGGQIS